MSQTEDYDLFLHCDRWDGPPQDDPLFALAVKFGRTLQIRVVENSAYDSYETASHISTTTLLKLEAVKNLVEIYDRVLYVDTDMLFFSALPLRGIDFKGNGLAAVIDVAEAGSITDPDFAKNCHNNAVSNAYFNAGLLYFNSGKVSMAALAAEYARIAGEHRDSCPYKGACTTNDQCAFNLVYQDQWTPLPLNWNVQSTLRFTKQWGRAVVRHYTGPKKFLPAAPWRNDQRDVAYIKRIARELSEKANTGFSAFGLIYRLNGLRVNREVRAAQSALAAIQARGLVGVECGVSDAGEPLKVVEVSASRLSSEYAG